MFSTVLIANRGEIACRIITTLRRLGIASVAVYSDADASARHVGLADTARRLGPAPAAQSYLDIDAVIAAARETGAEAIHPGYGFLAENAEFARACEAAGLTFIGPTAEAMEVMGDKIAAKRAVGQRGVDTVPGLARPGLTDQDLIAAAPDIGYPLLIKPSAGGGGKGMHVVEREAELASAIAAARREAAMSFGDDTLFLERYLADPRHIEVQILADTHGNVIQLGERECSLQRRHQKVIEEAPSPLLDQETRGAIGEAACRTARSVDYRGAGTVEFIVEGTRPDEFFFMEMNTRLQVEHPVTEEVTGLDLVEQQVRIAAGEELSLSQPEVRLSGHSIEARVYAEDPAAGFLPTGGRVEHVRHPQGPGIRVDTALFSGAEVSVDYDPMLAKVIARGRTREQALNRLKAALGETVIIGFPTNVEFLRLLLGVEQVRDGNLDTGLIARVQEDLLPAGPDPRSFAEAAVILDSGRQTGSRPWERGDGFRLGPSAPRRYRLVSGEVQQEVDLREEPDGSLLVRMEAAEPVPVRLVHRDGERITIAYGDSARTLSAYGGTEQLSLARDGSVLGFSIHRPRRGARAQTDAAPQLESPMPGTVVLTPVSDGSTVRAGDPVIVVEAMKMEHVLRAGIDGVVSLQVGLGDTVARGQGLATIIATGGDHDE